jgi:hypothetical protein
MGFDGHVVTVVMQMGDRFLGDGNVQLAMEFYHEASHMFPHVGICYIRETQCHVVLVSITLYSQHLPCDGGFLK